MATTIRRLVSGDGSTLTGDVLESMAREVLQPLEDEELAVSFGTWEGDDYGMQFVCKVETPPGDPLGDLPPWRWWSSLFRTPAELRAQLEDLVARRLDTGEAPAPAVDYTPSASAS
jgi:hypothetical protein